MMQTFKLTFTGVPPSLTRNETYFIKVKSRSSGIWARYKGDAASDDKPIFEMNDGGEVVSNVSNGMMYDDDARACVILAAQPVNISTNSPADRQRARVQEIMDKSNVIFKTNSPRYQNSEPRDMMLVSEKILMSLKKNWIPGVVAFVVLCSLLYGMFGDGFIAGFFGTLIAFVIAATWGLITKMFMNEKKEEEKK